MDISFFSTSEYPDFTNRKQGNDVAIAGKTDILFCKLIEAYRHSSNSEGELNTPAIETDANRGKATCLNMDGLTKGTELASSHESVVVGGDVIQLEDVRHSERMDKINIRQCDKQVDLERVENFEAIAGQAISSELVFNTKSQIDRGFMLQNDTPFIEYSWIQRDSFLQENPYLGAQEVVFHTVESTSASNMWVDDVGRVYGFSTFAINKLEFMPNLFLEQTITMLNDISTLKAYGAGKFEALIKASAVSELYGASVTGASQGIELSYRSRLSSNSLGSIADAPSVSQSNVIVSSVIERRKFVLAESGDELNLFIRDYFVSGTEGRNTSVSIFADLAEKQLGRTVNSIFFNGKKVR